MKKYDFLVVGAGLYGSMMAYLLHVAGKSVYVIDKRYHLGGNCFSYKDDYGIDIHKYGPHVFHTSSKPLWNFVNSIVEFDQFEQKNLIMHNEKTYPIPINLKTINDFFNINLKPGEVEEFLKKKRVYQKNQNNIKSWCYANIGPELYHAFIEGYTKKQWQADPAELPADIIKRLPIRSNYDSRYFNDKYSGQPSEGWGSFFNKLMEDIHYSCYMDYFDNYDFLYNIAEKTIYTGPIDTYFRYSQGILNWRSLQFDTTYYDIDDYQGNSILHYSDEKYQYTRSVEYTHFKKPEGLKDKTVVVYEKSCSDIENPFYPVNTEYDKKIYNKYKALAKREKNVFFGGRLAEYKYYDMDKVIEKVFFDYRKLI